MRSNNFDAASKICCHRLSSFQDPGKPKRTTPFFMVLQIPSGLQNLLAASATISTDKFVFIPVHDTQVAITIANVDEFFAADVAFGAGATT